MKKILLLLAAIIVVALFIIDITRPYALGFSVIALISTAFHVLSLAVLYVYNYYMGVFSEMNNPKIHSFRAASKKSFILTIILIEIFALIASSKFVYDWLSNL